MSFGEGFALALTIVVLMGVSYFCGLATAERFLTRAEAEQKDALRKQYARLMARVDADDPAQPYVYSTPQRRRFSVDNTFLDRLRKNGSATMAVPKDEQA